MCEMPGMSPDGCLRAYPSLALPVNRGKRSSLPVDGGTEGLRFAVLLMSLRRSFAGE